MHTYKKLAGFTYQYTESLTEVPDFVTKHLDKHYGINFNNEKFICATWSFQFGSKGDFYVILTNERVITRKGAEYNQIYLNNITSIERSVTGDTILKAAGSKIDLFHIMAMPKKDLLDVIFSKINHAITLSTKPTTNSTVSSAADELKKFAELKAHGIITEEEFQSKKMQILS